VRVGPYLAEHVDLDADVIVALGRGARDHDAAARSGVRAWLC